ncbi:unnamed protein product [Phytomonas sp. EM1]|nr:unnamed protein product [Phytomonas sp. EM1]|eukprot:CCW63479.1 unnamed protein product [Phytomonas sp. isolate EM1]
MTQRNSFDVLLLGEGNFTFTYSLVKKLTKSKLFHRCKPFGVSTVASNDDTHDSDTTGTAPTSKGKPTCFVLTTSFDSIEVVMEKYPESLPIMKYFNEKKRISVEYVGGVNATKIQESLGSTYKCLNFCPQLIIFNNPHIGIEDLYRHRSLLSHTFASIRTLPPLPVPGPFPIREVVLSLCDDQPLRWGLLEAAARGGFVCVAAVPLLGEEFPDYAHARGQSDARFPYKWMVQYYFVYHADFKNAPAIYNVIRSWRNSHAGKEDGLVAAPQFETWCRIYEYFYGNRIAESPDLDFLSSSDNGLMVDDFHMYALIVQGAKSEEEEKWKCMPLVHPSIVFYTSGCSLYSSVSPGDGTYRSSAHDEASFSPYLDLDHIATMYRLQMRVEELARRFADSLPPPEQTYSTPIPYHLNTSRLGRPLNPKEAAKLERYLRGYGCAKAGRIGASSSASSSEVYACAFCPSPRHFSSKEARDYHIRSKHSVTSPTPSGVHAKTSRQIIGSDYAEFMGNRSCELREARCNHPESEYCSLCDLLFVDCDSFREHLQFLTPQEKGTFVCTLCEPPESFVNKRALLQHNTFKHLDVQ